jgi:acetylornithine deacetylase/succinyl-diaminopimelate desuccinylase-like protein
MAVAEIDLRTTTEATSAYLSGLIRQYVEAQGYFLVDREPTDAERAAHAKLATLRVGKGDEAARQEDDSPIGKWAVAALEKATDQKSVRLRQMGGTVPTAELVNLLQVPFVLVPLVNADDNQHTYDENLRMGNFLGGIGSILGLMLMGF